MSEKIYGTKRKGIDAIGLILMLIIDFGALIGLISIPVIVLLSWTIIKGVIVSIFWNVVMITMFDVQKITIVQASVLVFTVSVLISNCRGDAKSAYEYIKKELFDKTSEERKSKIVSVILTIVIELSLIFIAVESVMYSWNSIFPQLLLKELVQINFGQAFVFVCLFIWISCFSGVLLNVLQRELDN